MSETTTNRADRARPARPQAVLTVLGREQLSPHTVRITAGGPGFEALRMNEFTDKYAKILFVDPALGLTPPYDLAALRESLPPGAATGHPHLHAAPGRPGSPGTHDRLRGARRRGHRRAVGRAGGAGQPPDDVRGRWRLPSRSG